MPQFLEYKLKKEYGEKYDFVEPLIKNANDEFDFDCGML